MSEDDVKTAVQNLRRVVKMKRAIASLPVLKLETYRNAKNIEEILRKRLERASNES